MLYQKKKNIKNMLTRVWTRVSGRRTLQLLGVGERGLERVTGCMKKWGGVGGMTLPFLFFPNIQGQGLSRNLVY